MDSRPRRSRRTQPGHLAGRYREDAPPPERRGLPSQRVRNPIRVLALGLLAAVCSAALVTAVVLFFVLRPRAPENRNAIWLGISWGQNTHTDEEVTTLTRLLRAEGIGTAYVWTSWLQEDSTWSPTTFENMAAFVQQFKASYPEARLEAWIGLPVEVPKYRLDDEAIRTEVAAFAARTLADFGFDGVHLNAEPVWDGDENFTTLLRDIRLTIGDDVPLSVAVPPDWNTGAPGIPAGPYTTTDAHWSLEYKQQVAFLVDELAVMAYNSGLSLAADYQTWMAFQVTQYVSAVAPLREVQTRIVIGIPTYDAELPGHDPAAESIAAAIAGIRQGLEQSGENADLVTGVGIYADWSTDALEWATYRELWIAPK